MTQYTVAPIVRIDGMWTVDDETIAAIYLAMQAEGTAPNISGNTVSTPDGFVDFLHREDVHPLVMLADSRIGGVAWLSHVIGRSAWAHFGMLKWAYREHTHKLALAALDYWDAFDTPDGEPFLRVLLGATPKRLSKALSFVRRVGFVEVGEVPYIDDGHPVVMTYRTNWRLQDGR